MYTSVPWLPGIESIYMAVNNSCHVLLATRVAYISKNLPSHSRLMRALGTCSGSFEEKAVISALWSRTGLHAVVNVASIARGA